MFRKFLNRNLWRNPWFRETVKIVGIPIVVGTGASYFVYNNPDKVPRYLTTKKTWERHALKKSYHIISDRKLAESVFDQNFYNKHFEKFEDLLVIPEAMLTPDMLIRYSFLWRDYHPTSIPESMSQDPTFWTKVHKINGESLMHLIPEIQVPILIDNVIADIKDEPDLPIPTLRPAILTELATRYGSGFVMKMSPEDRVRLLEDVFDPLTLDSKKTIWFLSHELLVQYMKDVMKKKYRKDFQFVIYPDHPSFGSENTLHHNHLYTYQQSLRRLIDSFGQLASPKEEQCLETMLMHQLCRRRSEPTRSEFYFLPKSVQTKVLGTLTNSNPNILEGLVLTGKQLHSLNLVPSNQLIKYTTADDIDRGLQLTVGLNTAKIPLDPYCDWACHGGIPFGYADGGLPLGETDIPYVGDRARKRSVVVPDDALVKILQSNLFRASAIDLQPNPGNN